MTRHRMLRLTALTAVLGLGLIGCGQDSAEGPTGSETDPTTQATVPQPEAGDVQILVEHSASAEVKVITHEQGEPLREILEDDGEWTATLPADQLPHHVKVVVAPRDGSKGSLSCTIIRDGQTLDQKISPEGSAVCETSLTGEDEGDDGEDG